MAVRASPNRALLPLQYRHARSPKPQTPHSSTLFQYREPTAKLATRVTRYNGSSRGPVTSSSSDGRKEQLGRAMASSEKSALEWGCCSRATRRDMSAMSRLRPRTSIIIAAAPSSSSSGQGEEPEGAQSPGGLEAEGRYKLDSSTAASGLTIPTMLTLLRVAVIPVLIAVYYTHEWWSAPTCCAIFVGAAITDWLDGYLARKWKQTSAFGAFLDPVADKLMVCTAMVLLSTGPATGLCVVVPWLVPVAACVTISREILISALREWAAAAGGEVHKAVAVGNIGKWKTATQMVSVSVLLLLRDTPPYDAAYVGWLVGLGLLMVATFLALWSMISYSGGVVKYMFDDV